MRLSPIAYNAGDESANAGPGRADLGVSTYDHAVYFISYGRQSVSADCYAPVKVECRYWRASDHRQPHTPFRAFLSRRSLCLGESD
ncbi:hypothetical protein D9M71_667180 [compost metagenome]